MVSDDEFEVVGLGEALFDCFEHEEVLGGAPLNFASHAHAMLSVLNGRGTVASKVGCDELGHRVCQAISAAGMDASFIQRSPDAPTGKVEVKLSDGGAPTYHIAENVAWDQLEFTPKWQTLARDCDAVAFGTLAQRKPTSRETIRSFLRATNESCLRIFDINLRQSFYDRETIATSLRLASILKLSEEELEVVTSLLDLPTDDVRGRLRRLLEAFKLTAVTLTRGARGTRVITADGDAEGAVQITQCEPNADSVGAGDATCAAVIVGLLHGWPLDDTVELANRMGAFVASRAGATPALAPEILEWIQAAQRKNGPHSTQIA